MFLPSNMTLSPGDTGDFVRELQRRLSTLNLYPAEALSGFYDGMTTSAVTSFQFQNGLRSDGIAGPETLRRLNGVLSGTASNEPATPAAQPAEDVMKTMYMVDHMIEQEPVGTPQHQHDVFTFQPTAPVEQTTLQQAPAIQPAAQSFVPPTPVQQQPVQPQSTPAVDPFAAAVLQQQHQQHFAAPAPAPQQPAPQPMKPIDAMLQPAPQPMQPSEKTTLQPVQEKPLQPTQPQPMKPIDAMLQPAPQPAPQPVQTPQPAAPVIPKPIVAETPPLEQKPVHQPQPIQQQPKPLEQQPAPPPLDARAPQPQHAAAKPAIADAPDNENAAPERQSLRQRFTGMMQRIADYMESKLPQSVQAEVQKIGLQMAERGVREIPIPSNETALPSPSATPGRGPAPTAER